MRPIKGRHCGGFNRFSNFMGPLLMGGGGGLSVFLGRSAGERWLPDAIICVSEVVRVEVESSVVRREMDAEVERDSLVKGFGADAKFLKEGSDIRGAFQGNRRITMQLQLAR